MLVGVVTWTTEDLIMYPADVDPVKVLVNFKEYYKQIPGSMDTAMLIS